MPSNARTILEAALAALDDDETETTAERMAGRQPHGSGHNDPMLPRPKPGEAVKHPTNLARAIYLRELDEREEDS